MIAATLTTASPSFGALAMVAAMAFPEVEEGGKSVHGGKKGKANLRFPLVSKQMLSYARTVLKHAPDLAAQRGKKGTVTGRFPMVSKQRLRRSRSRREEDVGINMLPEHTFRWSHFRCPHDRA